MSASNTSTRITAHHLSEITHTHAHTDTDKSSQKSNPILSPSPKYSRYACNYPTLEAHTNFVRVILNFVRSSTTAANDTPSPQNTQNPQKPFPSTRPAVGRTAQPQQKKLCRPKVMLPVPYAFAGTSLRPSLRFTERVRASH